MKQNITCPECGLSFTYEGTEKICFCSNCGTKILFVDDTNDDSYEEASESFRKGRKKASSKKPDERVEAINEIVSVSVDLEKIIKHQKSIDKNRSELADLVEKYDRCSSKFIRISAIIVPVVILVFFIIFAVSEQDIIIFWSGLALSVMVLIIHEVNLIYKRIQLPKEIDKLQKRNEKLHKKIGELTEEIDESFIPEKYRTSAALDYLYDKLNEKKALDLEQAIQLYEGNTVILGKGKKKRTNSSSVTISDSYDRWGSGDSFMPDGVKEGFKGAMGGVHEGTKEVMKVYKTILKDTWKETRKSKHKR